jgi:3-oxoadipate enol-lactonase
MLTASRGSTTEDSSSTSKAKGRSRLKTMSQSLYYRTWGKAHSKALLLIHPLGADHQFWDEAAELFGRKHFCIAPDLRSAGRSPVAGHPLLPDEHVGDLDLLCQTLSVGLVTVVGCAVGAVIAAAFASRASTRTKAVILSNPTVSFGEAARDMLAQRVAFAHENGMAALAPQIVERAFFGMSNDEKRRAFLAMVSDQTPQGYGDIAEGISSADIADDLRNIRCAALVVTSTNDLLLPPVRGNEVAKLLSRAEVTPINEGAHFIPYQAAPIFSARVEAFLSRQVAQSRDIDTAAYPHC